MEIVGCRAFCICQCLPFALCSGMGGLQLADCRPDTALQILGLLGCGPRTGGALFESQPPRWYDQKASAGKALRIDSSRLPRSFIWLLLSPSSSLSGGSVGGGFKVFARVVCPSLVSIGVVPPVWVCSVMRSGWWGGLRMSPGFLYSCGAASSTCPPNRWRPQPGRSCRWFCVVFWSSSFVLVVG